MTRLFIRLFVKNPDQIHGGKTRSQYGILAAVVGIFSNLLLFFGKIIVGIFAGSIAIQADAMNNLTDSLSSVLTLVGFQLGKRPPDPHHPYGHARWEYISSLFVSLLVILVGMEFLKSSFQKALHPSPVSLSWLSAGVLFATILIKLWQGRFNKTIGKRIDSAALMATAADSMSDVLITASVLITAVLEVFTGWQLDGWVGMAVALFIMITGFQLIRSNIDDLLGHAPSLEKVAAIEDKILSYEGIIGFHDLMTHNYGPGQEFASVHVEVPAKQDILVSHDIIDNMEHDFLKNMGIQMVIHMDPIVTDDAETTEKYEAVTRLVKELDPDMSIHDFRMVKGKSHTNFIFDVVVPFSYEETTEYIKKEIGRLVLEHYPNHYCVITVDRNYISTS